MTEPGLPPPAPAPAPAGPTQGPALVASPAAVRGPRPPRVAAVDWLRGLAVVLMIQAHGFDAWLMPAQKTGDLYWFIRHLSGLPSRLFLLLVGVTAAIKFESQLARGVDAAAMRWGAAKRGLQVLALAYLFRLQEHILAGFNGGWKMLFRVDILNAIGFSLLVVAAVAVPRRGRPAVLPALAVAAVLVALGPVIGPAHFPGWLPRPLTSYIGGQRPMSWFPLFPWGAWALVGVALGHLWVRSSREPGRAARVFILTAALGALATTAVIVVRALAPDLIRYPSDVVQQMGPGSFFYRLGIIGGLAGLGWAVTRFFPARGFSPFTQLGQTSLFIYWIHVDLCYGGLARPLRGKLTIPEAALWIVALILLMLGLSVLRTRHGRAVGDWIAARLGRPRARREPAARLSSPGQLGA